MGNVTKSSKSTITSPSGNSLAIFVDGSDNQLKLKDVRGNVQLISDYIKNQSNNYSPKYGSFYDTTNQQGGSIKAFTLNTTDFSDGVSIENNSEITFSELGKYNIQFSAQLIKSGGQKENIWFWLSHNGNDVPDSATVLEMGNNNTYLLASWNFFVDVNVFPQWFELK